MNIPVLKSQDMISDTLAILKVKLLKINIEYKTQRKWFGREGGRTPYVAHVCGRNIKTPRTRNSKQKSADVSTSFEQCICRPNVCLLHKIM